MQCTLHRIADQSVSNEQRVAPTGVLLPVTVRHLCGHVVKIWSEHMMSPNSLHFQVHLRHLVGGRARSYMGELPHEKIYQVEFPERPGALRQFLSVLQPEWNITLFHYRRSGMQVYFS